MDRLPVSRGEASRVVWLDRRGRNAPEQPTRLKIPSRLLSLGLLALALAAPAPPLATASSTIAWSRFDQSGSRAQIVAARPNGSQLQKLTDLQKNTTDIDPVISPDGTQVALERDLTKAETSQVVVMDADGQDERVLDLGCVEPCAVDLMPSWVNSGDRIMFTRVVGPFDLPNDSARSAVLQTAMLDGTDVQRFSEPGIDGTFEDYHARFSPDGSYLVFVRIRNADLAVAIFRMDADGSNVRRLTPWGLDADLADLSPATSGPTKDLVVFETYGMGPPEGKSSDVVTVPATCAPVSDCKKRFRYVTENGDGPVQSFNPSWAPNGRRIAYVRFKEGDRQTPPVGDIWTVRYGGDHRRPVSKSPRFEFRPDWGPAPSK